MRKGPYFFVLKLDFLPFEERRNGVSHLQTVGNLAILEIAKTEFAPAIERLPL